jgi:hypothetical protein
MRQSCDVSGHLLDPYTDWPTTSTNLLKYSSFLREINLNLFKRIAANRIFNYKNVPKCTAVDLSRAAFLLIWSHHRYSALLSALYLLSTEKKEKNLPMILWLTLVPVSNAVLKYRRHPDTRLCQAGRTHLRGVLDVPLKTSWPN